MIQAVLMDKLLQELNLTTTRRMHTRSLWKSEWIKIIEQNSHVANCWKLHAS